MEEEPDEISKLLRLKRFEQPPPEYFENFLREFKDRQRSQLLREPAWRIAWDRLCAFIGEQMPARIGYGLASTAVLVAAAIASFNILESRPVEMVVSAHEQRSTDAQPEALTLNTQTTQVQLPELPPVVPTASSSTPRYVIGAQPVSYNEPPSSF
jgi:hypothetical protein